MSLDCDDTMPETVIGASAHPTSDSGHRALRSALGTFATGITIVTTTDFDGKPVGLTVNSFSSVSLDPPLVAWSLRNASPLLEFFRVGSRCAIHVLRADQEALARCFASPGVDRFLSAAWQRDTDGTPLLADALARFDTRIDAAHGAGDHRLLLARVERYTTSPGSPLLFVGGRFRAL